MDNLFACRFEVPTLRARIVSSFLFAFHGPTDFVSLVLPKRIKNSEVGPQREVPDSQVKVFFHFIGRLDFCAGWNPHF